MTSTAFPDRLCVPSVQHLAAGHTFCARSFQQQSSSCGELMFLLGMLGAIRCGRWLLAAPPISVAIYMNSRLAMKPFDLNTRRTRAEIGNIHWRDEFLQLAYLLDHLAPPDYRRSGALFPAALGSKPRSTPLG